MSKQRTIVELFLTGSEKEELRLKKCPGCESIASDEEDKCGVCSASLLGVQSTDESLEQAVTEINAKQKTDDQRLDRAWRKGLRRKPRSDSWLKRFLSSSLVLSRFLFSSCTSPNAKWLSDTNRGSDTCFWDHIHRNSNRHLQGSSLQCSGIVVMDFAASYRRAEREKEQEERIRLD